MVRRTIRSSALGALLFASSSACASSASLARAPVDAAPASVREYSPRPLSDGETGVAVTCAKVLTADDGDRVFDPGMIVVRDGRIEYVGEPLALPAGFPRLAFPRSWA